MEILKVKERRPSQSEISKLHGVADANVSTLTAALTQQAELNAELGEWDAFVLASDLEGLLLDTVGQKGPAAMLGPDGKKHLDRAASVKFADGAQGRAEMASWLGSKGWNSARKPSSKAKPHLPSALLREYLMSRTNLPRAVRPLDDWLRQIVSEHERSPL